MKLLLIMPDFFDYPQLIIEELINLGYEVDYFSDRPSSNPLVKAIIRVNKRIINIYIKMYYNKMMQIIQNKEYDIVLLISGQSLSFSEDMICNLRKCQNKAKFVLYQWDSQNNFPYIKCMQKYFDKCFSFDKNDVKNTVGMDFLPLFYSKDYEKIGNNKNTVDEYKYDFCFVGTAHPKKYAYIREMSEQLAEVYPKQFIYFYYPSIIVYLYRKIFNKELRKARYSEFHFAALSRNEMKQIYSDSKCVLDSAQAGQMGLTIRVLEALGAKKKIITTNQDVVNYDFYRQENIYVYEDSIDLSNCFFKEKYVDIDDTIYNSYSLRQWLEKILM